VEILIAVNHATSQPLQKSKIDPTGRGRKRVIRIAASNLRPRRQFSPFALCWSLSNLKYSPASRVANVIDLWQTVAMTNQQTSQPIHPQHREDYKVEKLMKRIEAKMALQAKAVRESERTTSKQ
jgi:hypothetical protein